ncbi:MAG TPA: hypothetical protein VFY55_09620 [Nitrososphaeraceae archaeon]|nr:hypothetical protein [Nitrososphaeraceae archaeon]
MIIEIKYIYIDIRVVVIRKPVLLIDDTENSWLAKEILKNNNIEFVEYHIRKFEENCCVDLPTTRAPALFAPEGIFRNLEGIKEYLTVEKKSTTSELSESTYW